MKQKIEGGKKEKVKYAYEVIPMNSFSNLIFDEKNGALKLRVGGGHLGMSFEININDVWRSIMEWKRNEISLAKSAGRQEMKEEMIRDGWTMPCYGQMSPVKNPNNL